MAKEELLELDGIVDEVLPDSRYRVTLDNGVVVGAYASGRMRKNHIRILAGDRVTLELSELEERVVEQVRKSAAGEDLVAVFGA